MSRGLTAPVLFMARLKIGVHLDCLRLPVRQAARRASELGVAGVQVAAVGELAPENLTATGRRDLRRIFASSGLTLSALGFPTRYGFAAAEGLEARIAALQKVLALSFDLRAPIVTGPIGRVPADAEHPARRLLAESMSEIGRHAERVGAVFAVETGTESGATLREFIDALSGTGIRACLDPANLLVKGYDPLRAVRELGDRIVYSHARDAVVEAGGELGREVPLGQGDLDWPEYLGALEEVGYRGWLTVDVRQSTAPAAAVAQAVEFLRRF
jgi:L-ribulose-5-phosphate 3-epimerase